MTRRQGGVDYYLDGALVKTNATAWDVDLSLVFTAGRYLTTDLDGTVESIALMNDTTGETVWQAAYSDLYDTSNPWPSPVPRNFAEEPMTWRDEKQLPLRLGRMTVNFHPLPAGRLSGRLGDQPDFLSQFAERQHQYCFCR